MSTGACRMCGGFDPLDGRTPACQCGTAWARRRRTGLTRSTGLAPGKGLTTRTPMAQGKGLTRKVAPAASRAPLARQAPAPRPRGPRVAPEVRDAVLARSGGRCEIGATPACRARQRRLDSPEGGNQHHRRPGGMGGSKRASIHQAPNLLQVCGSGNVSGCHGHIERNRTLAYANGWLVHDGQDPAVVPVLLHDGRRVLLDADGYRAPAADLTST